MKERDPAPDIPVTLMSAANATPRDTSSSPPILPWAQECEAELERLWQECLGVPGRLAQLAKSVMAELAGARTPRTKTTEGARSGIWAKVASERRLEESGDSST